MSFLYSPDHDKMMEIIKESPKSFSHVLKKDRDYDMCMLAVSLDGSQLLRVPDDVMCQKIVNAALKNDISAIKYANSSFITRSHCRDAVLDDGNSLRGVPLRHVGKKIVEYSIKNGLADARHIPDKFMSNITYDDAILLVMRNQLNIDLIPQKFVDEEMLINALAASSRSLRGEGKTVPHLNAFHDRLIDLYSIKQSLRKSVEGESFSIELIGGLNKDEAVSIISNERENETPLGNKFPQLAANMS